MCRSDRNYKQCIMLDILQSYLARDRTLIGCFCLSVLTYQAKLLHNIIACQACVLLGCFAVFLVRNDPAQQQVKLL